MSMSNMTGLPSGLPKKKTHRGKRGGKKHRAKAMNAHHAQAQTHLANAMAAPTPAAAHGHLFKALTALNKAKQGSPIGAAPSAGAPTMGSASMVEDTDNDGE